MDEPVEVPDALVDLRIDPALADILGHLAPGVLGYTDHSDPAELWIPVIVAEQPGAGAVRAYLDTLPTDVRIVVPNVISPILAAMLERRGFHEQMVELSAEERALTDQDRIAAWVRERH